MKKTMKTLALAAAFCALCGTTVALVACDNKPADKNPPTPQDKVTISWQFTGTYDRTVDPDLKNVFGEFDFLANLTSDNKGVMNIYFTNKNGEGSAWEESLTWSTETDRDGLTVLTLRDKINPDGAYEMYQETDGTFNLSDYYFNLGKGSGFHRNAQLVGSATIEYTSVDAWKEAMKTKRDGMNDGPQQGDDQDEYVCKFAGPEVIVTATGEPIANCGAEVMLYEDGKAKAINGYWMEGSVKAAYVTEEGTWAYDDDDLKVTINGTEYTVTVTEGTASFTWATAGNNEGASTAAVTCAASELPEKPATATATHTFWSDQVFKVGEDTAIGNRGVKVELMSDNTVKVAYGYAAGGNIYMQWVTLTGTWSVDGEALKITIDGTEYTATKQDGVYSFELNFANNTGDTPEGDLHAAVSTAA